MIDTTPRVANIYRAMLMQRSGEERLRMGFGMFQFSRALVRAAVRDQHFSRFGTADISPGDEIAEIFRRTYGSDFDAAILLRIMQHLSARVSEQTEKRGE